jgi:eukaryotic-like serine/threonine-protein kinase
VALRAGVASDVHQPTLQRLGPRARAAARGSRTLPPMAGLRPDGFPRVFGPYLLLSSLGRGGMGEVFLAKRRVVGEIDRLCIVKTLRGDLADSAEYVGRFLDEARVACQLSHGNICQIYDAGLIGADHYLAMEYVAGVNVRDLQLDLARSGRRLDEGAALYLCIVVLDALDYAHRFKSPSTGQPLRVIHRDVSPANVMVGFDGDVKLIDFGLAESTLKEEHTQTRVVMGKVGYMPPEQARGDEVDGSCDQFATAVMLYELVSGGRFYGDMNAHQIWQIVGHGGHRPPLWSAIAEDLRLVLDRALASTPAGRYPSAEAFGAALEEIRARRHPRATKAAFREIVRSLYADRAEAQADLVASFADVSAPAPPSPAGFAEKAPRPQPPALAGPAAAGTTDPWKTSPSRPFGDPLPGPSAAPAPGDPVVTAPPSAATSAAAAEAAFLAPFEPTEASASALAPPQNSAARLLVAGLAAAVAALGVAVAVSLARGPGDDHTASDLVATVKESAAFVDAAAPPAADGGPAAHEEEEDAGAKLAIVPKDQVRLRLVKDVAAATGAGQRPEAAAISAREPDPPPAEKLAEKPVDAAGETPEDRAADTPSAPVTTLQQDLALLERCANPCAAAWREKRERLSADPRLLKRQETIIRFCAKRCREAGAQ